MAKNMAEGKVHRLIQNDEVVQDRIKELLNLKGKVSFIHEDKYINGITADFSVVQDGEIKAIIECKAGGIDLTDYVRGIGQLLQYEYCFDKKIPHKNLEYSKEFKTIYFYPDTVISKSYNIGQFKYPKTCTIYVLKERTNEIQEIPKRIMKKIENMEDNLIMVSPYYVRDIRIFEYYMMLRYIFLQECIGIERLNRRDPSFIDFFKKIKSINKNFTNGWITLSACGLIDGENLLTEAGKRLAVLDYEEFAITMYHNFFEPYFNEILYCFDNDENYETEEDLNEKKIRLFLSGWEDLIRKNNDNRDVCFLTDGEDTQSISSWLNIMRDDFGIIKFKPRRHRNGVKLVYDPRDLNDNALMKKVKEYSVGYEPLQNFQLLLKKDYIGDE